MKIWLAITVTMFLVALAWWIVQEEIIDPNARMIAQVACVFFLGLGTLSGWFLVFVAVWQWALN